MQQFVRDVRLALRIYSKRPGQVVVAIITLAVGIGANVAVFSVARGVLLSELPYPRARQVVALSKDVPGLRPQLFSQPEFESIRDNSAGYQAIAGCSYSISGARGSGDAEVIIVIRVTPDFFSLFGVAAMTGRVLASSDFSPGGRTTVISYDLWASQFALAPDVIGRVIRLGSGALDSRGSYAGHLRSTLCRRPRHAQRVGALRVECRWTAD